MYRSDNETTLTAAIISSRNMVSAHYANIYNVQPIMWAYIYVVSVYYFGINVVLSMPMYILKIITLHVRNFHYN